MSKGQARRKILANAGWLGSERIVRSATALFVVVWIARYLGPEQFGLLNYAQSLAYAVYPIATFGLTGVLVKDLVQSPQNRDDWQSAALFIRFLAGSAAFIFSLVLAAIVGDMQLVLLVGIIALAFLLTPADGLDAEFQARMNNQPIVMLKLLVFAGSTVFKVLAIVLGAGVFWFAGIMTLEVVMIAFGSVILLSRLYGMWTFRLNRFALKEMVLQGLPMMSLALLSGIYVRIDQILLGMLAGYDMVGEYAAAWKLVEAGTYLPNILLASLAPVLANQYVECAMLYQRRYAEGFRLVFWLVLCGCISVSLAAPWLIDLLFSHKYQEAVPILRVLVWSALLTVFNLFAMQWAINHRKGRIVWEMTAVGLLFCIGLCFSLIPSYGGLGAATAIILSQVIGYLGYGWCRKDGREILKIQFRALAFR